MAGIITQWRHACSTCHAPECALSSKLCRLGKNLLVCSFYHLLALEVDLKNSENMPPCTTEGTSGRLKDEQAQSQLSVNSLPSKAGDT